jgi:predicted NAD/FAD-binding protein
MRIAIVGAGVSGLVCAHVLHRDHELVVFEASDRAGGHANTVHVETDTGA